MKYKLLSAFLMTGLTSFALAATAPGTVDKVTATPLQKAPFDTKKPLYVTDTGAYSCPDGFEMFIRQIAPKTKDKAAVPTGDFESFFYAKTTGDNPPIIVSRPGIQEFVPACLQIEK